MDYKVIDNFLDKEDFDKIKNYILGTEINWKYAPYKVYKKDSKDQVPNDFQFSHVFYINGKESEDFYVLDPIFKKLNAQGPERTKANITAKTSERFTYDMHTDYKYPLENVNTAVLYLNTNDGLTVFENGDFVESVENRIVIFDSGLLHAGTSSTDQNIRCVLNINYAR